MTFYCVLMSCMHVNKIYLGRVFVSIFFLGFSHHNMTDRDYIDRDLSLLGGFRKSLKLVCIINLYCVN